MCVIVYMTLTLWTKKYLDGVGYSGVVVVPLNFVHGFCHYINLIKEISDVCLFSIVLVRAGLSLQGLRGHHLHHYHRMQ